MTEIVHAERLGNRTVPLVRPMGMWSDAADVFAGRDGVATLAELNAAGVSERMITGRVASKELIRVGPALYRCAYHPHTDRTGVRIPVLLAGGIADRWTALFWHGLNDQPPHTVTATVARERRLRVPSPYSIETRRRELDPRDVTEIDGLPVTRRPLTVLEVCDAAVMDRALQTRSVTLEQLSAALDRNAGAAGIRAARRVFAVASGDTESAAERLFVELLDLHRITGWRPQVRFRGYLLDFAFPEARVAVEINGWAYHRSRSRWMNDQNKQNALTAAGWSLLNYSWHHLTTDPEGVIGELTHVLQRAA